MNTTTIKSKHKETPATIIIIVLLSISTQNGFVGVAGPGPVAAAGPGPVRGRRRRGGANTILYNIRY
jgi:hypothetical protein